MAVTLSKGRHVFITCDTDNGDGDDEQQTVYFCIKLHKRLLERAEVLAALADTSGMVNLPCGISSSDFLLWQQCWPETTSDRLATRDLTRILQVADKLADQHVVQWARLLANRAAQVDWSDEVCSEEVHCALLSLPSHTQHIVFQEIFNLMPPERALATFPVTLHNVIVASMVDSNGSLEWHSEGRNLQRFLSHLRTIHPPQRGLRGLSLRSAGIANSEGLLLSHALLVHSKLTSLSLSCSFMNISEIVASVAPALPNVSSMRQLSIEHSEIREPALRKLQQALETLPNLASITLDAIATSPPASSSASDAASTPLNSLISTLSSAPSLTYLSLSVEGAYCSSHAPAGSFQQLSELHLTINLRPVPGAKTEFITATNRATWLVAFGALPALEHLELEICAGYESTLDSNSAAVNAFVPGAWKYVSRLKTLKHLEFDLTCIPDAQASSVVWATLADTLQALPQLEKVKFGADEQSAALEAACPFLRVAGSLTSLHVHERESIIASSAWVHFFTALRIPCCSLKDLHLPLDGNASRNTGLLADALAPATALSSLTLQAGGDVYGSTEPLQPTPELRCATLAPVLATLTTLRKLAVHDICIITPRELWRALGCISVLQDLRLTFCQIEESEAEPLVVELQRLQALRVLDLHGNHLLGPGALVIARALVPLPCFQRAELGMNEIDEEYDDAIASLRKDLCARGISLNIGFNPPQDC